MSQIVIKRKRLRRLRRRLAVIDIILLPVLLTTIILRFIFVYNELLMVIPFVIQVINLLGIILLDNFLGDDAVNQHKVLDKREEARDDD